MNLGSYLGQPQEFKRSMRSGGPVSLIMADIDKFKAFNDNYGHQAGDDCLKDVAKMLGSMIKRPGDLVARYGGEEFAIILPETNLASAGQVAQSLKNAFNTSPITHAYSSVAEHVTLSFGVASFHFGVVENIDVGIHTLIETADKRLYQVKKQGGNAVVAQE